MRIALFLSLVCIIAPRMAAAAPAAAAAEPTEADVDLWKKIGERMTSIQALRYTLTKQERLHPGEELTPEETFAVKFRKPYDIYMDVVGGPNIGRHYLYRGGWEYLKVHVFGRALQWLIPKIRPISSLALAGNHHAITDAGYDHTVDIVRDSLLRNVRLREQDPHHPMIQVDPVKDVVEDGVPSLYFRSVNPDVFKTYVVTRDDKTIFDVARKTDCEPYLFMYYNDKVRKYDDLHEGESLQYPLYYGRVAEFWVDKKSLLIRHIRVTDFFGKLYEDYVYRDLVTDEATGLNDFDFDPKNPEYEGF